MNIIKKQVYKKQEYAHHRESEETEWETFLAGVVFIDRFRAIRHN
jgi:hypothetical protein